MIKLIKSTFYKEIETKKKLSHFLINSEILSFGSECMKFESSFARWQGRKEAVFVNSGSSANLAVIQALLNMGKLHKGDKVGFSAVTWSTNVMPLIQLGLVPVPIDIELDTLNISTSKLKVVLKDHALAMVFVTNLLGFCDDLDSIAELCEERKILLIEDNCESLGTIYKGKKLGNYGFASTFSFYVGHHMSTIEGGAICTDDEELATMVRLVRAHGWDRNLSESNQNKIRTSHNINSTFYSRYTFYDLGFNLRPTEINGFLGNNQLQFVDEICEQRRSNFLLISSKIHKNTNYIPLRFNHIEFISNFAVPVVCTSQLIRNELVKQCDAKIEIRPIVGGDLTCQPFFTKYEDAYPSRYTKNARFVHKNGLYFGNNPDLTKPEIDLIFSIFC